MSALKTVFTPVTLGAVTLKNRFIMAPLTRTRATVEHTATPIMVTYYADRASAGLLIAEATNVSKHSGFYTEPGIYTTEQVDAWKKVTEAVHAKGGLIFLQIVHPGRAAHSLNSGLKPVGPSAVAIEGHQVGEAFNPTGAKVDYEVPSALTLEEIAVVQADFVAAATRAVEAGFDGVEVHSANGYLLDEFLKESANKRDDHYGGSVENRVRMTVEVVSKVAAAIGSGRVGVRISPINSYNGMMDSNPEKLTTVLCEQLSGLNLAYLHVMRADFFQAQSGDVLDWVSKSYKGNTIANMGYSAEEAEKQINDGLVKAVAFGMKFLANADFVERTERGAELNQPNYALLYGRTAEGYNDYPLSK